MAGPCGGSGDVFAIFCPWNFDLSRSCSLGLHYAIDPHGSGSVDFGGNSARVPNDHCGFGGGGGVGRVEGEGVVLVVLSLFLLLLKFVSDAHVRVFVVVVVVGVVVGDESGLGRFSNTELAAIVADWYALALFSRSPWTSSKCSWLSNHSWSSCFAFSSCNGPNKGSLHCLGFVIVAIVDFVASVFFEAECPW